LVKVETELDAFEADYLAGTLKSEITKYREVAALDRAVGRIDDAKLAWCRAHSDFIEGIAKRLFPDWDQ
jgi:hypothetical protein